MLKIRTIIIDSNPTSKTSLKKLLRPIAPIVSLEAEIEVNSEAISISADIKPDLVFINVDCHNGEGFRLLGQLDSMDRDIVVMSSDPLNAYHSFEYVVSDFLLLPLDQNSVNKILARYYSRKQVKSHNFHDEKKSEGIVLKIPQDGLPHYFEVNQLIRMEASRNYTWVIPVQVSPFLISRTLSSFHDFVQKYGFIRIHNSHLINPNFIVMYHKNENKIELKGGLKLPVARNRKKSLLEYLSHLY